MQHVSHQTAIALRDAGFPQPEPAPGQYWYDLSGEIIQVLECHTDDIMILSKGNREIWISPSAFRRRFVFAPTAPDILRELGLGYGLYVSESGNTFVCRELSTIWTDENPAEACAKAWLAKHAQSG